MEYDRSIGSRFAHMSTHYQDSFCQVSIRQAKWKLNVQEILEVQDKLFEAFHKQKVRRNGLIAKKPADTIFQLSYDITEDIV